MTTKLRGLPRDVMDDYHDTFHYFDPQGRGYLETNILRDVLKYIGYNPTDQQLEELSIEVDENGSGRIEFDEFVEITQRLNSPEKLSKDARDAFNAFDFMGEGYVAANDVKEALMNIMEKAPEHDKAQILKHFRLEKNRKIYFREFEEMINPR